MQKNVASQKLILFAFDATTNLPKTGDAANITPYVSIDGGAVTVLGSPSASEMDATNAKGYYSCSLAQAETNGNMLLFSAKSTTANIVVIGVPATVFTTPANFATESIDSNGRLDVIKINGTSQTARDLGASVLLSAGTGTGQLDFTSGLVNVGKINGISTSSVTTVSANQGTTQPINFTGTGASALVKGDAIDWASTAIPAPNVAGVPQVDLVDMNGVAVTASSAVTANVTQWNGSAVAVPATSGIPTVALLSTGLDIITVAGKTMPVAIKYIGAMCAGRLPSGAGSGQENYQDFAGAAAVDMTIDASGNRVTVVLH